MPLDPQIDSILKLMQQAGGGQMSAGTPQQARQFFDLATVTMRDPSTLASVGSVEDRTIPGPAGDIPIRIYRPDGDGPSPTMAFFHGGGFVIGSIETHDDHARRLCHDLDMVVVSVDYRLAPEHKFPAAFEDCLAATRWVAENIDTLGGDPDKIVVGGDSAGGNLSAAVALATVESGPRLAAQFLIYPGVDFDPDAEYASRVENAEGYFLTADDMIWFGDHYIDEADRRDIRASTILGNLAGAPPAVIGTAEFDPLRDEGEAYAKALADAGVEVRLQRYDGLIHGFYGMGPFSAAADAAISDMNNSLKELLA
ncbi:MAG: alpha/beta hydrolase [Frankiaceae bacterium]|nr:alpha/beta hydrolase [Frankiaceae bacterium]MBV9871243.1 alpha/beta hydrolase [Frankiaceae bacterium]